MLVPVVGARALVTLLQPRGVCGERSLLLLYDLPQVEHGVQPEVHHLDGGEKDRHHGTVNAGDQQARRESL